MHFITKYIRENLLASFDRKRVKGAQLFFKEGFKGYGVQKPQIKAFAIEAVYRYSKPLDLNIALSIARELFQSRMYEECQAAIILLEKYEKKFNGQALTTFAKWIDCYVENWAVCDSFCLKVVSYCFINHPRFIGKLSKWAFSKNRWKRRAACVVFTKLCRKGEFTEEAANLAHRLICDKDEMVQKGVGWLLKEVSRTAPNKVINFLNSYRIKIPSRVRAYAMERMDSYQKQKVKIIS